jgi:uncharacterized protein with FMN-binding domain
MMTKKLLIVMAAVAAISLLFAACFVESDPDNIPQGDPLTDSSGELASGTAESTAQGYLGQIKVTLIVKDGYIIDVKIEGSGDAASLGGDIIKNAPAYIKKANYFDIDALASASPAVATKTAITNAGTQALAIITGN